MKHISPQSGIATSNNYIATAGYDNKVILWDKKTHRSKAIGHHDHIVNQVKFSSCGKFLASSSSDYSVRIWEVPTMRLVGVCNEHLDDAEGIDFHPSEELIATTSRDGKIRVFNYKGHLL